MEEPDAKVCPACGTRYDVAATFCQRDGSALVRTTASEGVDPYIGRTLLEQFRIEQLIGAGGMGTVYRARQTTIDRDVAIKILHPELVLNPDAVRRFHREARVSASLDHPNVVRVFLFGQLPDKSLYLVMEHLRGRSLLDVLRVDGILDPMRALHVATQICDGVGEAHRQGVVHRDVKPENVVLVTRGRDPDFVKVLDFGIARFVRDETTVATQSGLIFGTARYISPEGAAGEPTDARSDVYSIAVLTYQLLTGETPFDAASPVGLLMKHIHEASPDIRTKARGAYVPPAVADVIMRALSKSAEMRPLDANALAGALRAAAMSSGVDLASPRYSVPPAVWQSGAPASVHAPAAGMHAPRPMYAAHATPVTPRMPPMQAPSPTLEAAPSPFGDPTGRVAVRGLPGARRGLGPIGTLFLAFVLGAVAVGSGAFLVDSLTDGPAVEVEDLETRARAALARGDIDTPPGDNVADLTARIFQRSPQHAGAIHLRQEAARRLREEAITARAQGFVDEARARYRRAIALSPDDVLARRALAELEAVGTAPIERPVPGIRVSPEEPAAGDELTLVAVLDSTVSLGDDPRPHFHVQRNGRSIGRAIAAEEDDDGAFVATYRFRGYGTFELVFMTGEDERLRRELTVSPARTARSTEPPATTQATGSRRVRTEPALTTDPSTSGDGIDWRLPEERRDDLPSPSPVTPLERREATEPPPPIAPPAAPEPDPEPPAPPEPWSNQLL